jgi:hypothetical protein
MYSFKPADWRVRAGLNVLVFLLFCFILLRPLWKLAMARPGLIIVFSRVTIKIATTWIPIFQI